LQWQQIDVTFSESGGEEGRYDYFLIPVSDGALEGHDYWPSTVETYEEIGNFVYGL
jgi:hypothetical protein